MEKILKNRLVTYMLMLVLALTIVVFAGDVIVKEGDLHVAGTITGPPGGDYPDAYITNLYVDYYASFYNGLYASSVSTGNINASNTISCYKLHAQVVDPAGVLYDLQTRQEIIDAIKRTIAPDKQGGALVFFNKDTKELETYVPSEGKFYDFQGKLLYTMPKLDVATDYKTVYYLDIMTGEVKAMQEVVCDRYIIKKGYRLDIKTGHFINAASGEIVPKETAVEFIKAL